LDADCGFVEHKSQLRERSAAAQTANGISLERNSFLVMEEKRADTLPARSATVRFKPKEKCSSD